MTLTTSVGNDDATTTNHDNNRYIMIDGDVMVLTDGAGAGAGASANESQRTPPVPDLPGRRTRGDKGER